MKINQRGSRVVLHFPVVRLFVLPSIDVRFPQHEAFAAVERVGRFAFGLRREIERFRAEALAFSN